MSIEITKTLQEKVKENVGSLITEMLTEDQLNDLIQSTFEERIKNLIEKEIDKLITVEVVSQIKQKLATKYGADSFFNDTINKAVEEIIVKNAGAILADILQSGVQMQLNGLYNNLSTNGYNITRNY